MSRVPARHGFTSLPVRPVWLFRVFAMSALMRVPAYSLAAGVGLFLATQSLACAFGDGSMVEAGWWSATVLLTILGLVLGSLAGLAAASGQALQAAEADVRDWLARITEDEGDRLFPTIDVGQLQGSYEAALASMYSSTIGRLPLPGFVCRKIQMQFRHALLDQFLTECEQRGVTAVRFADVRRFVMLKALPAVTQPLHTQVRIWTLLLIAPLLAGAGVSILIALLADHVDPPLLVAFGLGTIGLVVLCLRLPRASRHASPQS